MTTAIFTPSDWLDLNHASINVSLKSCGDDVCSAGEDHLGCPEDCQQSVCVAASDDLHLSGSAVLCPASYELPDQGSKGVIIIDADDVTLNCNGARLVGDGSGVGILVAGRSDVTITGCTLQGYAAGIGIKDTTDARVQSTAVISNTIAGIYAFGSAQAQIQYTYMAGNHMGIDLSGASGAQLSANLICGNSNLDVLAAAQSGGVGHDNRCQAVSGWHDQAAMACRYPCAVYTRFYLPMVRR